MNLNGQYEMKRVVVSYTDLNRLPYSCLKVVLRLRVEFEVVDWIHWNRDSEATVEVTCLVLASEINTPR